MPTGNVIDQFWVALGIKADTAGLRQFQQQTQGVKDSILELGRAAAGIFAGGFALHKVAEIGSTFEQNRIAIAGFMQALKLSPSFESGLEDAAAVMRQITTDAAKLPGEAEEYIEVFRAGLPDLKAAMPGANAVEISKFTNTITALGKTLKIDAPQIGRDLKLMLGVTGRAGGHVRTFQELIGFMRLVPGQAHLTAASFNAMSQEARAALLQQTFGIEGLQKMLGASASSFDAMMGALKSGVTQMVRLGTEGLFEGMKKDLDELNKVFFDADGNLTETGRDVVDMLKMVGGFVRRLLRDGMDIVKWLAKATKHSTAFKAVLMGIMALFASSALSSIVGVLGRIVGGFRLMALVTGLAWVALGLLIEDVYGFFTGAESVTGELVNGWAPAIYVVIAAIGGLMLALSPVLFTVALIGVAVVALYMGLQQLKRDWEELGFVKALLNGWITNINMVIDVLNKLLHFTGAEIPRLEAFGEAARNRAQLAPGEGVLAPTAGPTVPFSMGGAEVFGAQFGTPNVSPMVKSETHVGTVNINGNDDPKKMARSWNQEVRDAQSRDVL